MCSAEVGISASSYVSGGCVSTFKQVDALSRCIVRARLGTSVLIAALDGIDSS